MHLALTLANKILTLCLQLERARPDLAGLFYFRREVPWKRKRQTMRVKREA
jgi:hypothetical protein